MSNGYEDSNRLSISFWRKTIAFVANVSEDGDLFFKFAKKKNKDDDFDFDKTIKMGLGEIGDILNIIEGNAPSNDKYGQFYHSTEKGQDTQINVEAKEDGGIGIYTVSGNTKRNFVMNRGEKRTFKEFLESAIIEMSKPYSMAAKLNDIQSIAKDILSSL